MLKGPSAKYFKGSSDNVFELRKEILDRLSPSNLTKSNCLDVFTVRSDQFCVVRTTSEKIYSASGQSEM